MRFSLNELFKKFLSLFFYIVILFLLLFYINNSLIIVSLTGLLLLKSSMKFFILKDPLFLFYFILFYFTYTIFVSEYVFPEVYSVGFTEAKSEKIYLTLALILFTFAFVSTILFDFLTLKFNYFSIPKLKNEFIYESLFISLIFILIFSVDRTQDSSGYAVRISSLFEYSKILFIYLFI